MESAGFTVRPYHVAVPTFGVWGFALAGTNGVPPVPDPFGTSDRGLRFLNDAVLGNMFEMPADLQRVEAELNQLNNQILVRYYEQEWGGRG
jgi:spermidine synthase